ncbi:hypothetical protein [Brevibacillus dissolubilis]|uniref:hypothetical protein n=1 Tax=Brevibacillus dissolubilis TaxID=1844116 RepID=UPI001116E9CE|nr:hypothetical protein [Brevibacillus dissolubilis]
MVTLGLSISVLNDGSNLSLSQFGNEICILKDNSLICVNTCETSNPSLTYTLGSVGVNLEDVHTVSVTHSGQPWMITDKLIKKIRNRLNLKEDQNVVVVPSKQMSYAYTSYFTSGVETSLLIVANQDEADASQPVISYYMADKDRIEPIDYDFAHQDPYSFSRVSDLLVEYLALNPEEPVEVQKLALFGKEKYKDLGDIWSLDAEGHLYSTIPMPADGEVSLAGIFTHFGVSIPAPRDAKEPLDEEHAEIAQFIQGQMEKWFSQKVNQLLVKHPVNNVCISGDLSQNRLLLDRMASTLPISNVYIPPMDYCQNLSIGNTIYSVVHAKDTPVNINELKLKFHMENIYRTYLCCC